MVLCENCIHDNVCADRDCMDEDDERALKTCRNFKNKADFVEEKHGEWINGEYNNLIDEYEGQCSECRRFSKDYGGFYCSNCGAKMDGRSGAE